MPEYTRQRQQPDHGDDLLAARIAQAKGPVTEKRLPDDVRSDFEARSGYSARNLRVVESDLPRATDAYAVTQGSTIHFPRGGFAPGTSEGRETLMHELAHTVQQAQGKVRANRAGVVNDSPALEQAADTAFAGPAPTGENSVASASLAAMPTPSAGAPMQLRSPIRRIKDHFRRTRATGQVPADTPAPANADPSIAIGTALLPPTPSPAQTGGQGGGGSSGNTSGGQGGNASGGPANASQGPGAAAGASGSTAADSRVFDQDLLEEIDPNFTEEELEQGMGKLERAERRSDVDHEKRKALKRKFYDEVRAKDQGFAYDTGRMKTLMEEIRGINPWEANLEEGERRARHQARDQKIQELHQFRQQEEARHLNWLYSQFGANSSMPRRERMAKRQQIDKAVRHNQKKDLKAYFQTSMLMQMLQGYNGRIYDAGQHAFTAGGIPTPAAPPAPPPPSARGRVPAGQHRAGNTPAPAAGTPAPAAGAPAPAGASGSTPVSPAAAATQAAWRTARPEMTAATRTTSRPQGPALQQLTPIQRTRGEKAKSGFGRAQDVFGVVDQYGGTAIGSDQEVQDIRESFFAGAGKTGYEHFVNSALGTGLNHGLSAVGLANDAFNAVQDARDAHKARMMGDKMEAAEKSLNATGNIVSAGGRFNGFFSASPDPLSSAFSLVGNVTGTAAGSVGVASARHIKHAMRDQMATMSNGMNTTDPVQAQRYRMRREAEMKAKRKHVDSGFTVANNVVGGVGNAAGLGVGPGTIIKIAAMGLTGLGTLAQMITGKALEVHHRHVLLDEISQSDEMLQLLLQSGAMGLDQHDIRKVMASASGSVSPEDMRNRMAAVDAVDLHRKIQSVADPATLDSETKEYLHGLGFTDETKFKNITVDAIYEKLGGKDSWERALAGGKTLRREKKQRKYNAKAQRFRQIFMANQAARRNGGSQGGGPAGGGPANGRPSGNRPAGGGPNPNRPQQQP